MLLVGQVGVLVSTVIKGPPHTHVVVQVALTMVLNGCARAGQLEQALALLRSMLTSGLTPSVAAFPAATRACRLNGRWELALALLDEMGLVGVVPVADTYVEAVESCLLARRFEQIRDLVADMRRRGLQPPKELFDRVRARLVPPPCCCYGPGDCISRHYTNVY
jgi:pentatricopeptide repeat protein